MFCLITFLTSCFLNSSPMRKYITALGYTALLACSPEPITSGTLASKQYEPELAYFITTKNFWTGEEIKTKFIDDEDFIVVLQQFGGTKFKSTRQRQIYVSKTIYDSLKVGDSIDLLESGIKFEEKDKDVEQK